MAGIWILLGGLMTITQFCNSQAVDDCPVKANCDCSRFVDCYMRNITELPPMVKTVKKFSYVSFKSNYITRVENGYFSQLTLYNSLIIDLSYNRIKYIAPRAFQGLEDVNLDLRLEHNNIVALPHALLPLNNLGRLRISGIHTYDSEIVEQVTKTLTMLNVGDFTEWPEGIKLFTGVESLYLFELRMSTISANDLKGLAPSLDTIVIQDSSFEEPLDGLCSLPKIRSIQLINLTSPEGVELTPRCESPITSINRLLVERSYLVTLSRIQKSMPGLSTLNLKLPNLRSLTIPAKNNIEALYLWSMVNKIPASSGPSEHLKYLNILDSKISSIEREDMRNFPNLRLLDLVNSSLVSISEDAFENNQDLSDIHIFGSNLTSIPKAITRLPKLSVAGFFDSPIKCSCEMAWLLGWPRFQKVRLVGDCLHHAGALSTYTKNDLSSCDGNPTVG